MTKPLLFTAETFFVDAAGLVCDAVALVLLDFAIV